jgi:hypothetical protein
VDTFSAGVPSPYHNAALPTLISGVPSAMTRHSTAAAVVQYPSRSV